MQDQLLKILSCHLVTVIFDYKEAASWFLPYQQLSMVSSVMAVKFTSIMSVRLFPEHLQGSNQIETNSCNCHPRISHTLKCASLDCWAVEYTDCISAEG